MRRAWVVSIGTELVLGQKADSNAGWLARRLAGLGFATERHVAVPDELEAIRRVVCQGLAECDLVITSGGLGPTDDDLTREALARVSGAELVVDRASLAQIRAFFAARGREMPAASRVQARRPRTARALPNPCGTAPGIALELSGRRCYALPGVPLELQAMFELCVAGELQAAAGGRVLLSRRLLCCGAGEAEIGARLGELMSRGRNPQVGTSAAAGLVAVRLDAAAPSRRQAAALLDQTEADVCARLGRIIFGREGQTLAGVVGELLAAAGRTVCTAESCTGGLIGKLLTDVPGSSRYYLGSVVSYCDRAKRRVLGVRRRWLEAQGAVSVPVARALARGVRGLFGSDFALAVTGIAGPAGGTREKPVGLVYIALATPRGLRVHECRFGASAGRATIRLRAARTALDLLRLTLLGAPARRNQESA